MSSESLCMLFPLPDHLLPRVDIDVETIADWKAEALDAVSEVLMDRSSWYYRFDKSDAMFTRAYDRNGLRGCSRMLPGSTTVEYLSQGELHMTLDDVVYAMVCDTTQQQRALQAQLYQDVCVDSAILQLYEGATAKDPFHRVAMIWSILHPEKMAPQDYIHFQITYTTADADGRTVLVHYRKSHDLRPDQLIRDHGLEVDRKHTFSIKTFCADNSERVVMSTIGHVLLKSKFTTWVFKRVMPVVFKRTLNHHKLIHARNLELIGIAEATLQCDKNFSLSSTCRVCCREFCVIWRRKWCQGCGHAVCRNCNMEIALLKSGVMLAPRLPLVLARFCLRCLLHAGEQRIKRDLKSERILSSEAHLRSDQTEVDESYVDGLQDLHRELAKGSESERDARILDSDTDEETNLARAIAKAEELTLIAAMMAENTTRLREIHQQRFQTSH